MSRISKYIGMVVTNLDTGTILTIDKAPEEFCKYNNIAYNTFRNILTGKIKISKGWFIGAEVPDKESILKGKPLSENIKKLYQNLKEGMGN